MGDVFRRVPGFRSGTRWKQVVAVIGYLLIALLVWVGAAGGNPGVLLLGVWGLLVVWLSTNAFGLRDRVPLLNSPNRLVAWASGIGATLIGFVVVLAATPTPPRPATQAAPVPAGTTLPAPPVQDAKPAPTNTPAPTSTPAPATPTALPKPTTPPKPTAPPPPPTLTAEQAAEAQWGAFLEYGPKLGDLLARSDEVNRLHAEGARAVTVATVGAFLRLTDQAAASHGTLKAAALGVRVPEEARPFRQAVYEALRQREEAMISLKRTLEKPGIALSAAYQEARRDVDLSTVRAAAQLFALCDSMGATPDMCMSAMGWSTPR